MLACPVCVCVTIREEALGCHLIARALYPSVKWSNRLGIVFLLYISGQWDPPIQGGARLAWPFAGGAPAGGAEA